MPNDDDHAQVNGAGMRTQINMCDTEFYWSYIFVFVQYFAKEIQANTKIVTGARKERWKKVCRM